jgi:formate-nitrite transporter family protein
MTCRAACNELIIAGWLMGLMSWLAAARWDTISQIVSVWLISTVFGNGRLHHIVAGSVEGLADLFAE